MFPATSHRRGEPAQETNFEVQAGVVRPEPNQPGLRHAQKRNAQGTLSYPVYAMSVSQMIFFVYVILP